MSALAAPLFTADSLEAIDTFAEVKAAYFMPTQHRFQEIYSGGGMFGIETTTQAWKELYAWASASYFNKTGSSIGRRDSTQITLVPLGAGAKYLYHFDCKHKYLSCPIDFYAGVGILATYVDIEDNSHHVVRSNTTWVPGGILKAGAFVNLQNNYFLDIFTDYSFMWVDYDNDHHGKVVRNSANVGGWSIGVGIGYHFGKPTKKTRKAQATNAFIQPTQIQSERMVADGKWVNPDSSTKNNSDSLMPSDKIF